MIRLIRDNFIKARDYIFANDGVYLRHVRYRGAEIIPFEADRFPDMMILLIGGSAYDRQTAMLHSDGDLNLIIDQLIESGIDGLQSIDPQGHMDHIMLDEYEKWAWY